MRSAPQRIMRFKQMEGDFDMSEPKLMRMLAAFALLSIALAESVPGACAAASDAAHRFAVSGAASEGHKSSAAGGASEAGTAPAAGTALNPYIVPRVGSSVEIDGILDDAPWNEALILELPYEYSPGENTPAPVRTEVLLVCGDRRLYAAFRCYDPDPSTIRSHLYKRDDIDYDDWVGIYLDTFNDERRNYHMRSNSFGIQEDFIESESGSVSWDGIWDSAGRITEWGYVVEMSIPYNQLRFQGEKSRQVWGFDAVRSYPRNEHRYIGSFPRDRSNNCYRCQMIKIAGFEGVSPGRNIEFAPTLTGVWTDAVPDFPGGDLETRTEEMELGITGAWGIRPNMTLSGAVHPDFSQVEADALILDINEPFALLYSEKRPFFTEGQDFFRTLKSAVYTRMVRDPQWGVKLTGKENAHTIGAYIIRDDVTNLIFPGSQSSGAASLPMRSTATVLRYKRDIGSRYTVGGLLTDREGSGYFNRVLGFDADLRPFETDRLQLQFLGTFTEYPEDIADEYGQKAETLRDEFIAFEWDHVTRSNGLWLDYDRIGTDFRADLGFIPQVGYQNVEGGYYHTWNAPEERTWWSLFRAGGDYYYHEELISGIPLARGYLGWMSYTGAMQTSLSASLGNGRETYNGFEFELTSFGISGGLRPTGSFGFSFNAMIGDRIDYANTRAGKRFAIQPSVSYNMGSHLRIGLNHAYEHLDVAGGRLYTANASELAVMYTFSARALARSVVQYVDYRRDNGLYTFDTDSEYKRFFTQFLFTYVVNPRTILFLGYNGNHFGNEDFDLTQNDRTFFMKIGYALSM
jgi:hypothetical protein